MKDALALTEVSVFFIYMLVLDLLIYSSVWINESIQKNNSELLALASGFQDGLINIEKILRTYFIANKKSVLRFKKHIERMIEDPQLTACYVEVFDGLMGIGDVILDDCPPSNTLFN